MPLSEKPAENSLSREESLCFVLAFVATKLLKSNLIRSM